MAAVRRICPSLELSSLDNWHSEIYAGVQRFARERGWQTTIDDRAEVTIRDAGGGRRPYDGVVARVGPGASAWLTWRRSTACRW